MKLLRRHPIAGYEITLRGEAGHAVRAALAPLRIDVRDDRTIVHGDVVDQAALFGVMDRLRDLGVEIVEIRYPQSDNEKAGGIGA
jgi:hypothetical protein